MADAVAKTSTPDAAAGNPIDVTTVATGAGTVDRQRVSIGDATATNNLAITAGGAARVDGTATTQPVSGTVTTTPPADASTNITKLASTAISVNSGAKDAGTLRVVLATDQPQLTNKVLVTPDSVALPANQSVNLNQVGAAAITEGQKTMAASVPVVIASDQDASAGVPVRASPLCVVITPVANAAGTITLPAVAGQFHYITAIEVTRNATAALVGSATLAITTTNLPGGGTWYRVGNAMIIGGTQKDVVQQFASPIKSSVVNTNTTIVFPAPGAAVLWTTTVWYYTAP
jgi:hypothetical protein